MPSGSADLEASWIKQIACGDGRAFETFHRSYEKRLFRYLFKMVDSAEAAEELTSDVMLEVWKGAGGFKGRSKPSSWIFGIAHHKAMNELRRRRPREVDIESAGDVADPGERPEEGMGRASLRGKIQSALRSLSPEHREVIELTFYHGFSYEEIAQIVRCPVNTVKTRMFHAKRQLQPILDQMGIRSETA